MKVMNGYSDLGTIFDEIFDAARDMGEEFRRNFNTRGFGQGFSPMGEVFGRCFDEHTDYYPAYSYPPMNVYMSADRSLTFEFALAGFDEKDISLSFQGDYMVFSARIGEQCQEGENRYLKRRLKLKDIDRQKYFVPLDKYDQEKVKAVFKNGILRVTVPPKEDPGQCGGIKIEIIKEGT
ncbi:MAG: Hsp20/alpha crystallin family protein [Treponema sp.]|jgi:HSP20 family molecular chaperone IbpA|nr:Hsp20/alpha crystallin family protein [Treponema sp.]